MPAQKGVGKGKGTRRAGGKAAARPARSSTATRQKGGMAPRQGPSPLERVERARRIIAARAKATPDTWAAIAKRERINQRQAMRIYDDALTWRQPRVSVTRLVDETLDMITAQIAELDEAIQDAAAAGMHAARVGAIRLQMEAVAARWDVLARAGRVPADMRSFTNALDAGALFEAMVRTLRGKVDQSVIDELLAVVEQHELPAGDDGGEVLDDAEVVG